MEQTALDKQQAELDDAVDAAQQQATAEEAAAQAARLKYETETVTLEEARLAEILAEQATKAQERKYQETIAAAIATRAAHLKMMRAKLRAFSYVPTRPTPAEASGKSVSCALFCAVD